MDRWMAEREADYKRQHPNWRAEEAAEQAAFEVRFDAIRQRLGSDDAFRQAAAERFGPGYWTEADAMTDAHRVETLERQILLHAETRAEVASSLADADMNATSVPVPVEDSGTEEETEPVELVRMPPLPEPKAKAVEPAPEPEPEPVPDVEPEPEPTELPPVAAEVDRAARKVAEMVWYDGPLERKLLPLGQDEALAHSVATEWLAAPGELVVRGAVDPRPVSVTRIPN
jgi:hypothetical protein